MFLQWFSENFNKYLFFPKIKKSSTRNSYFIVIQALIGYRKANILPDNRRPVYIDIT